MPISQEVLRQAAKRFVDDEVTDDPYLSMMMGDIDDDEIYTMPTSEVKFDYDNGDDGEEVVDFSEEEFTSDYSTQQPVSKQQVSHPTKSSDDYRNQLEIGVLVETEHIHWWEDDDVDMDTLEQIATNIATDHLKVTPDYYTKLIQAGLVDEQDALDLYKSIYGEIKQPKKPTGSPLPPPKKALSTPRVTNYQSDFKMTLEPTVKPASIQPEGIDSIEEAEMSGVEVEYSEYSEMINENAVTGLDGFEIAIDDSGW